MNERMERNVARAGMAGAIGAAIGASLCCVGPVAAALFGLTSLAALGKYEPLRPALSVLTLVLIAAAFYATYRRRPANDCKPGSLCEAPGMDRFHRLNRVVVWIAAVIALVVLTFPTWSSWIFD